MKPRLLILISLSWLLLMSFHTAQTTTDDPSALIGKWKLDMSPENPDDDNFAMMQITSVDKNSIHGTFYRKGVKIREGRINTQGQHLYGALVSGDNSGDYNTAFYYSNGKLYGSTHSLKKDFLAVWTATKESD